MKVFGLFKKSIAPVIIDAKTGIAIAGNSGIEGEGIREFGVFVGAMVGIGVGVGVGLEVGVGVGKGVL